MQVMCMEPEHACPWSIHVRVHAHLMLVFTLIFTLVSCLRTRMQNPDGQTQFMELQRAYETLTDETLRRRYDMGGAWDEDVQQPHYVSVMVWASRKG